LPVVRGFIHHLSTLCSGALLLTAGVVSAAEEQGPYDQQQWEDLYFGGEQTIVTASRYLQLLRDAPGIVTVIDSDEIANAAALTVSDILKRVPGFGVSTIAVGYQSVDVRGIRTLNSEKILFLIDGHRVNNIFYGSAMRVFDGMPLDDVKRIEIIRGPGSALYGANAFAAVVNVITREGMVEEGAVGHVGAGSFTSRKANLRFGKYFDDDTMSGSINFYRTGGAQLSVASDNAKALDNLYGTNVSMAPGETDDWMRKVDMSLKFDLGSVHLDSYFTRTRMGSLLGAAYSLSDETKQEVDHGFIDLDYHQNMSEITAFSASLYYDRHTARAYWELYPEGAFGVFPDGMIGIPSYKNETLGGELQIDHVLDKHHLTWGALYEYIWQSDVRSFSNFDPLTSAPLPGGIQNISDSENFNINVNRYVGALYLQDGWSITPDWELTLGVRHDSYNDVGGSTNPRAGLVWRFSHQGELKLLYGRAFRAPSFEELHASNNPVLVGNRQLEPELIRSYELGVSYRFARDLDLSLNYFHNEITDHIVAVANPPNVTAYGNHGETDSHGVEGEVKKRWIDYRAELYLNASYQSSIDTLTDEQIADVARKRGNLGGNWRFVGSWNINANLMWQGERARPVGDPRDPLPSVALLDVALSTKFCQERCDMKLSMFNLTDRKYADPTPYQQGVPDDVPRPGRSVMLELGYRM